MKKTKTKKTSILSVLCYILAALFFLYGVYMLIYSIDYIQSYESTGLIDTQNVIQYVVTSSASYLGQLTATWFLSPLCSRMCRKSATHLLP